MRYNTGFRKFQEVLQVVDKHHFETFFPTVTIFFLLGIFLQFLPEMTTTITVHLRLVFVLTEVLCHKGLIRPVLQHNQPFAAILEQQSGKH